eukprot:SAG11_NODE_610_length_8221_cov_4.801650_9_plen_123_part_00
MGGWAELIGVWRAHHSEQRAHIIVKFLRKWKACGGLAARGAVVLEQPSAARSVNYNIRANELKVVGRSLRAEEVGRSLEVRCECGTHCVQQRRPAVGGGAGQRLATLVEQAAVDNSIQMSLT